MKRSSKYKKKVLNGRIIVEGQFACEDSCITILYAHIFMRTYLSFLFFVLKAHSTGMIRPFLLLASMSPKRRAAFAIALMGFGKNTDLAGKKWYVFMCVCIYLRVCMFMYVRT